MTTASSEKIQEFQDAGAAIIGGATVAANRLAQEGLQHVFAIATDSATMRKQTDLVQQVWAGLVDPGQLSIRVGGAEAARLVAQALEAKAKQSRDTQYLLAMLEDLDRLADEIEQLRGDSERGWVSFSEKYGGTEGILETFFTPEEREKLKTDDDIQRALVEKFLNEDGSLKPGAADILDPEDIENLRTWQKLHQKEREFVELVDEVEANGGTPKPEHKVAAENMVASSTNEETASMARVSEGNELQSSVIDADNDRAVKAADASVGMDLFG